MTTPVLLTAHSTAETLGISIREVRRLLREGELDRKYIGKKNSREYRVTYTSILAYADSLPSTPRKAAS